jgi:hypothetical protein
MSIPMIQSSRTDHRSDEQESAPTSGEYAVLLSLTILMIIGQIGPFAGL